MEYYFVGCFTLVLMHFAEIWKHEYNVVSSMFHGKNVFGIPANQTCFYDAPPSPIDIELYFRNSSLRGIYWKQLQQTRLIDSIIRLCKELCRQLSSMLFFLIYPKSVAWSCTFCARVCIVVPLIFRLRRRCLKQTENTRIPWPGWSTSSLRKRYARKDMFYQEYP